MSPKIQKLLQQAVAAHRSGRLEEARLLYARVLAKVSANFDALNLSGLLAHQQGRHREAVGLLLRAVRIKPRHAIGVMRLGAAYLSLGELENAVGRLREAVRIQPDLSAGWVALAQALQQQGGLSEARHACERALAYQPDNPDTLDRLGTIIVGMDGFEAAEPWFRQVVSRQPDHLNGWINLGVSLAMMHRSTEALPCFDRALTIQPGHPHALTGRGLSLERSYRIREAVETYGEALRADTSHHECRSARLLSCHYLDEMTPEQLAGEHRAYGQQFSGMPEMEFTPSREPDRRLRVAIISPDLRTHSVAYFLEPLLKGLSAHEFEIHLYHDHPNVDETSRRLQTLVTGWHHTAGLPHAMFVERVRADAPDIALDLAGHTASNRLPAFARRIAPVQISYLGYPNTTGLPQMDYRLTDAVCDPAGSAGTWHAEKLVRFAPTAWAYAPPPDTPDPVSHDATVNERPITFGCFNNFSKVSDSTLRGWAQLMSQITGSRLVLKSHRLEEPALRDELCARFLACGIDPERVDLLGRVSDRRAHLELYARVDVALDTYPYHGTTTTCEALWMGVPVVTLMGNHHAARVGGSLLTAIGHREWIASDWNEYGEIAANLVQDREQLAMWRETLRSEMRESALLDHAGQADRFAGALMSCWLEWCESTDCEIVETMAR